MFKMKLKIFRLHSEACMKNSAKKKKHMDFNLWKTHEN